MGFRDKVRAEANKTYKGLEIDDVPGGTVVLRSALRLSDDESKDLHALQTKLTNLEDEKDVSFADVRSVLIRMAETLADRKDGLSEYLSDFDTAELISLYRLWAKETQAPEAKSGK